MDKEYMCDDCDAEFNIEYDFVAVAEFCPFCGSKLRYDDMDIEEDWEDDETERGC